MHTNLQMHVYFLWGEMKFISLIDTNNQNIVTIDADSFVLRIEIDGIPKESRIKQFMASILTPANFDYLF